MGRAIENGVSSLKLPTPVMYEIFDQKCWNIFGLMFRTFWEWGSAILLLHCVRIEKNLNWSGYIVFIWGSAILKFTSLQNVLAKHESQYDKKAERDFNLEINLEGSYASEWETPNNSHRSMCLK